MSCPYKWSNLEESAKPRAKCYLGVQTCCSLFAVFMIVFTVAIFPIIFLNLVNSQVVLTNGTLSFDQWLKPTPAIYKVVTVYNVTNPDNVTAGGQPVLQAMGPYYFREYRERVNVAEVYDRELWFGEKKWYEFDYNKTNANLTNGTAPLDPVKDVFTTFNLAYVGVAYNLTISGTKAEIAGAIAAAAMEHEQTLFMRRSVKEVVFGYKDKFLAFLKGIAMPSLSDTVQIVANMSSRDINTFSKILNGGKNISNLGQYTQWQGYRKLPYWKTPEAAMINGTEGLFFAPNLDKTKTITTFVDDLFRANPLEFVKEEECMGLQTYKYKIPKYVMMNATNNPLNDGFYAYGPDGLMNLTAAVMAPVFASKPSFLDAEPWLQTDVTGLPPADNTMDTNLWVEPITGALVKATKQLQANVMIMKLPVFPHFDKLREAPRYVPMSNIVETGGMDEDLVNTFKNKVFKPRDNFTMGLWVLFGLCLFIGGIMGYLQFRHIRKNQKGGTLLIPNEGSKIVPGGDSQANIYKSV